VTREKIRDVNICKQKLVDFDLILSKGQSFQSKLVGLFNFSLMGYTHIGIIHQEENEIFVLHSTPDGTKENAIRYDSLNTFLNLSSASDITVLRLKSISDCDRNNLEREFAKYKSIMAPFDYDFDNLECKKIYCSELVYLIYSNAKLLMIDEFELSKPIHPSEFLKLSSFYEVDCKKSS
jgi:uncharacterized protein YycO